jgi:hypothetical protein
MDSKQQITIPTHHGDIVLPITKSSRDISLCLMEIGCKPNGKHKQLKSKRELLFRHFKVNIGMLFSVYKGFVYYNGDSDVIFNDDSLVPERVKPDFSIHYLSIPPENLAMNYMEREYILSKIPNSYYSDISRFLDERDTASIEDLLKESPKNSKRANLLTTFKGRLMEHICFTDIARERMQHPTIPYNTMYLNQHLSIKNKCYRDNGTEVDIILAFYDDRVLRKLLGGLEQKPHLELKYKAGSRFKMFAR